MGVDVLVAGGGVIGLSVAWRAAARGLSVAVADPAPGRGASHVAAGMLAPVTEAHLQEEPLLRLNLASAARYPAFVAELAQASGLDPGYARTGTLVAALDASDLAVVDELHAVQREFGLHAERLSGREARGLEPMLAPSVRGALLVPGDHQVDPRRLVAALAEAVRRAGVRMLPHRVAEVTLAGDRVTGAVLADGSAVAAGQVVLAAGCWTSRIGGLPPGALPVVRPVKGQLLRLRMTDRQLLGRPFLERVVRGVVRGAHVYLVPRADGELVLGATQEELGFDTTVTAGAVHELLRDARELVPGITELALEEAVAGLRPGTPDNAPLLGAAGPDGPPGLLLATGHHRNGVLLAPVTADALADLLTGAPPAAEILPFAPGRFARPPVPVGSAP